MLDKEKIYDLIFWTSMGVILLWIILKSVGVINTPITIQLIPYAGGIFAFGVFFQMIKDLKEQIRDIKDDIKGVKEEVKEVKVDLNGVKMDISQIKTRLGVVETFVHSLT